MLVTVARTEMAAEAHILRGRLEAEGLPAFVVHEHHVTLDAGAAVQQGIDDGVGLGITAEHAGSILHGPDEGFAHGVHAPASRQQLHRGAQRRETRRQLDRLLQGLGIAVVEGQLAAFHAGKGHQVEILQGHGALRADVTGVQ